MIDLHCHVLPGIDDGPATIEESVELARVAELAGITTIVATPHVNAGSPNDAATIARLVGALNVRLASEGVSVLVLTGAEIAISHVPDIAPAELSRLTLGGSGWLLIEPPFTQVALGLEGSLLELQRDGHRVVLAHPERCPALQRDRRVVPALVAEGLLTSITAGSLVGRFGGEVRRYALELAREGLVHNVTSDAHDAVRRPPGLTRELEKAGLAPLRDWLTRLVPEAILDGDEPPPAPAQARNAKPPRRPWRSRR